MKTFYADVEAEKLVPQQNGRDTVESFHLRERARRMFDAAYKAGQQDREPDGTASEIETLRHVAEWLKAIDDPRRDQSRSPLISIPLVVALYQLASDAIATRDNLLQVAELVQVATKRATDLLENPVALLERRRRGLRDGEVVLVVPKEPPR